MSENGFFLTLFEQNFTDFRKQSLHWFDLSFDFSKSRLFDMFLGKHTKRQPNIQILINSEIYISTCAFGILLFYQQLGKLGQPA